MGGEPPARLTFEEHRDLSRELRKAHLRLLELCNLVTDVYGSENPAGLALRTAEERTAIERRGAARRLRQGAVELKLKNMRQEVTHVRDVCGYVVFCPRIEVVLAAAGGRSHALILQP